MAISPAIGRVETAIHRRLADMGLRGFKRFGFIDGGSGRLGKAQAVRELPPTTDVLIG
jgi:hypothetical protein